MIAAAKILTTWTFFVFGLEAGVAFTKKLMPSVYATCQSDKSVVIFVISLALFTGLTYCTRQRRLQK